MYMNRDRDMDGEMGQDRDMIVDMDTDRISYGENVKPCIR